MFGGLFDDVVGFFEFTVFGVVKGWMRCWC